MKHYLNYKRSALVAIGIIANCILPDYSYAAAQPDPAVLLQAVEATRLQIPPSRLRLRTVYKTEISSSEPELLIEFDGDRRRLFRLKSGPEVRTLFDGSQAIQYDGNDSVTIRERGHSTSEYLFDPRLLGVTTTYSWRDTLATALPHKNASQLETIGKEQIDNRDLWHIRAIDSYNQQLDLWIDTNDFRVYRYDFALGMGVTNSTLSYYEDAKYPWLPTRVVTKYNEQQIKSERILTIIEAEANINLPEETWGVAGVKPPIGTEIVDLRIKQRIGYWDGKRVRPETESEAPIASTGSGFNRLYIVLLLTVAGVVGLFLYAQSARKET